MREFLLQVRYEAEQLLASVPVLILIKVWLMAIMGLPLVGLALFAMAVTEHTLECLEAGLIGCAAIFMAGYLNGIYERAKAGFYKQQFHPDIYE